MLGFQVQDIVEESESGITFHITNKRQKHKAIEHYEKFLDIWKDEDPCIAEVEGAKKRLEILSDRNCS